MKKGYYFLAAFSYKILLFVYTSFLNLTTANTRIRPIPMKSAQLETGTSSASPPRQNIKFPEVGDQLPPPYDIEFPEPLDNQANPL